MSLHPLHHEPRINPVASWETDSSGRLVDFFLRRPDMLDVDEGKVLGSHCWQLGQTGRFAWPVLSKRQFSNKLAIWKEPGSTLRLRNSGRPLTDDSGRWCGFRGTLSHVRDCESDAPPPPLPTGIRYRLGEVLLTASRIRRGVCLGCVEADELLNTETSTSLAVATRNAALAWSSQGRRFLVYVLSANVDAATVPGIRALRAIRQEGVRLALRWEYPVVETLSEVWIKQTTAHLSRPSAQVNLISF